VGKERSARDLSWIWNAAPARRRGSRVGVPGVSRRAPAARLVAAGAEGNSLGPLFHSAPWTLRSLRLQARGRTLVPRGLGERGPLWSRGRARGDRGGARGRVVSDTHRRSVTAPARSKHVTGSIRRRSAVSFVFAVAELICDGAVRRPSSSGTSNSNRRPLRESHRALGALGPYRLSRVGADVSDEAHVAHRRLELGGDEPLALHLRDPVPQVRAPVTPLASAEASSVRPHATTADA
jgi:hypothetical protein